MKICIEGAPNTGKENLKKEIGLKLSFMQGYNPQEIVDSYWNGNRSTFEYELSYLARQLENERVLDLGLSSVFSKGLLSIAVYTYLSNKISHTNKAMIYRIVKEKIKTYTFIIYLPSYSKDKNQKIDMAYLTLLKNWKIPYYTLKSKMTKSRLKEVKEIINQINKI